MAYLTKDYKYKKKSNFFGKSTLSPSYSFFKKKEIKKAICFLEVVNEGSY